MYSKRTDMRMGRGTQRNLKKNAFCKVNEFDFEDELKRENNDVQYVTIFVLHCYRNHVHSNQIPRKKKVIERKEIGRGRGGDWGKTGRWNKETGEGKRGGGTRKGGG